MHGNVELGTIRELLGHTTARMTERYAHLGADIEDAPYRSSSVSRRHCAETLTDR
jgi:hypothetical protein